MWYDNEVTKRRRGGMADAPVLGTGVSDVQVQVLSPAPKHSNPNLLPIGEVFGGCLFERKTEIWISGRKHYSSADLFYPYIF